MKRSEQSVRIFPAHSSFRLKVILAFAGLAAVGFRLFHRTKRKLLRTYADLKPVSQRLDQRRADEIAAFQSTALQLGDEDASVVESLISKGYAITSLTHLGLSNPAGLIEQAQELALVHREKYRLRDRAGIQLNRADGDDIAKRPQLFTWGLDDHILNIVESYFSCLASYDGGLLTFNVANGQASSARRWHCDHEDRQMVKAILYCADVGPDDGPFEVRLAPQDGPSDNSLTITGPAGTVILADTARLEHRGRPSLGKDRVALFGHYYPGFPRYGFACSRSVLSDEQIDTITAQLSFRQRAAALWRRGNRAPPFQS